MFAKLFTKVKTMLGYGPKDGTPPYAVGIPYVKRVPRALRMLQDKDKGTPEDKVKDKGKP